MFLKKKNLKNKKNLKISNFFKFFSLRNKKLFKKKFEKDSIYKKKIFSFFLICKIIPFLFLKKYILFLYKSSYYRTSGFFHKYFKKYYCLKFKKINLKKKILIKKFDILIKKSKKNEKFFFSFFFDFSKFNLIFEFINFYCLKINKFYIYKNKVNLEKNNIKYFYKLIAYIRNLQIFRDILGFQYFIKNKTKKKFKSLFSNLLFLKVYFYIYLLFYIKKFVRRLKKKIKKKKYSFFLSLQNKKRYSFFILNKKKYLFFNLFTTNFYSLYSSKFNKDFLYFSKDKKKVIRLNLNLLKKKKLKSKILNFFFKEKILFFNLLKKNGGLHWIIALKRFIKEKKYKKLGYFAKGKIFGINRKKIIKKEILSFMDSKFFINCIMRRGNKIKAINIFLKTYYIFLKEINKILDLKKKNPIFFFKKAINNIMPPLVLIQRMISGKKQKIPYVAKFLRRRRIAIRWIIFAAKNSLLYKNKKFEIKLAGELLDILKNKGLSLKKKKEYTEEYSKGKFFIKKIRIF